MGHFGVAFSSLPRQWHQNRPSPHTEGVEVNDEVLGEPVELDEFTGGLSRSHALTSNIAFSVHGEELASRKSL